MTTRPPFIIASSNVAEVTHSYPGSDEKIAYGRAIGQAAGLLKIGLHLERLEPGQRTSWPHAEEKEEEFVLVGWLEVSPWWLLNSFLRTRSLWLKLGFGEGFRIRAS